MDTQTMSDKTTNFRIITNHTEAGDPQYRVMNHKVLERMKKRLGVDAVVESAEDGSMKLFSSDELVATVSPVVVQREQLIKVEDFDVTYITNDGKPATVWVGFSDKNDIQASAVYTDDLDRMIKKLQNVIAKLEELK